MEASVRIFNSSSNLNHRLLLTHSILHKQQPLRFPSKYHLLHHNHLSFSFNPFTKPKHHLISLQTQTRSASFPISHHSFNSQNPNPLGRFSSLSTLSQIFNSRISNQHFNVNTVSDSESKFLTWNPVTEGVNDLNFRVSKNQRPGLTVVLLGWLGAEQKHLKRYVELYTKRGIRAVTFVVPLKDLLGFDLGKKVEKHISALTEELVSWLSEKDVKERSLIFHTFSNTGWFAYGAILENLQSRGNFTESIKGCVIDSGGDPEINPKVWAAGFAAALLKKRGSSVVPSVGDIESNGMNTDKTISKMQDNEPLLLEILLLAVLEKFFSFILKLPEVRQRLTKIISLLSNNQTHYPQLYLYSSADRVIPSQSVESFIELQRKMGRKVQAYNFGSSPHVDHLRSFPSVYSSEVHKFLEKIVTPAVRA